MNTFVKHYERTFDRKVKEFNKSSLLPDYFAEMIGDKKQVRIAEVGCALVNTIGDTWCGAQVYIKCSDKYADEFNALWKSKGKRPLHRIYKEDVESLNYASNVFDIVHCRNVLDHTEDPKRAIEELKRVSKEWVYLAHAQNQMDTYGGHHTFNARYENGQCVFYGKEYSFVIECESCHFDGELIHCMIKV